MKPLRCTCGGLCDGCQAATRGEIKLGAIVTLSTGTKADRPHVVVHEPVNGRVQLCYFGTGRWYVPEWHPVGEVKIDLRDVERYHGAQLRRCRRVLAAVKPGHDGWKRIDVGRHGQVRQVIVGHVDVSTEAA